MLELYQVSLISLVLAAVGVVIWRRLPRVMHRVVRVMPLEDCSFAAGSWLDSRVPVHLLLSWCHSNRPPPGGVLVVCPMPVDTSRKRVVNVEVAWTAYSKGFNFE